MGKISIPIYDETMGNRWGDFVERNRGIFGDRPFGDKVQSLITKILRRDKLAEFSKDEIKKIAKIPKLMPSEKTFKISRQSKIFTMGSCFARYIRLVLEEANYDIYPKFRTLSFDPSKISVASLPKKDSLIWYNCFTIRQEFQKALGHLRQDLDDVWAVDNSKYLWDRYPQFNGKTVYNDPYRRHIFSDDKGILNKITADLDAIIKIGIETSDVLIITLGVTEVWRKRDSGLICCAMPNFFNFGKKNLCELVLSDYNENYSALYSIVKNVNEKMPGKEIIFTVSPVPLKATFSGNDVYLATQESKAILRAAANKVAREFDNAHYFPAFEIFQLINIFVRNKRKLFNKGKRNLSMWSVETIVAHFLNRFAELDE